MLTEKEIYEMIEEQRKSDEIKTAIRRERELRIIDAENSSKMIARSFVSFVNENISRFTNKKLFLTNGSESKVMIGLFGEFISNLGELPFKHTIWFENGYNTVKFHVKTCVHGGKYRSEDNPIDTHYCDYINNTYFDLIVLDDDMKLKLVREDYLNYIGSDYNVGTYDYAKETVSNINKEIANLKNQLSKAENAIPQSLRK